MEVNQFKTKNCKSVMEDRISMLPPIVTELILSSLPIREAAKTSVLAKKWRVHWKTIPILVFELSEIPFRFHHRINHIISQILLLHIGQICQFSYIGSDLYRPSDEDIHLWSLLLCRSGIKHLELRFSEDLLCRLPSPPILFACHRLKFLELYSFDIKLPHTFIGFKSLTTLHLDNVSITNAAFADLVSTCPLLRKLVFKYFYECKRLKVNAPNLLELVVLGPFIELYLRNTPNLAIFTVDLEDDEEVPKKEYPGSFVRSLWSLRKIEKLELGWNMTQFMAKARRFEEVPTYSCLKKLQIGFFNFLDQNQIFILRCLLQNSPVLQELEIEADSYETRTTLPGSLFFKGKEWTEIKFDYLKVMTVFQVTGIGPELEFVKCVLPNAPALESLTVGLDLKAADDIKVYEQLMQLRSSPTLRIEGNFKGNII